MQSITESERKILIPSVIIGVVVTLITTFYLMAFPAKADANYVAGLSVALAGGVGVMILAVYGIKLNWKVKLPGGVEIGLSHAKEMQNFLEKEIEKRTQEKPHFIGSNYLKTKDQKEEFKALNNLLNIVDGVLQEKDPEYKKEIDELERADYDFLAGENERVKERLARLVKNKKNSQNEMDILLGIALSYHKTREKPDTIKKQCKKILINENSANALVLTGFLKFISEWETKGDSVLSDVNKLYEKALTVSSRHPLANYFLACNYAWEDDKNNALNFLRTAIESNEKIKGLLKQDLKSGKPFGHFKTDDDFTNLSN